MASNKTEAVVDFRGKGRQQVLEKLAVEFPVVDGQWTPTVKVAEMASRSDWSARIGTREHKPLMGQGEVRSSQLVDLTQERRTKPRARRS